MLPDVSNLRTGPIAAAIRDARLIAVLRGVGPRPRLLSLIDDLVADGLRLFEITLDGVDGPADLAAVRDHLAAPGGPAALVGAGTVRTSEQLRAAIDVGAVFGVSPILDRELVAAAIDAGLPFVPGAYTPTEIDAAWRAGATFVKLFPGSSLEPSHVRELRGPMPEIETIVTGGVHRGNAIAYLEAGAVAVGIGSALGRMSRDERRDLVSAIGAPR